MQRRELLILRSESKHNILILLDIFLGRKTSSEEIYIECDSHSGGIGQFD
jgi:hypothetical protein